MTSPTLLPPCPISVDDSKGEPRFGTYSGALSVVNLSSLRGHYQIGALEKLRTHKKWHYAFVATPEVIAMFAVVDVNYSSNAFMMALDIASNTVLFDDGYLGPPRPLTQVSDEPAVGLDVKFFRPEAQFGVERRSNDPRYNVSARAGLPFSKSTARLKASLLVDGAPAPLTVIAPVDGGLVNVTQKCGNLLAFGALKAGGRTYSLDGGVAGLDYTQGYLARETAWRWGFVCGRLEDGKPITINLVEGFNESRDDVNENAVWLGRTLYPIGRARFSFNKGDLLDRWSVKTTDGALDLHFAPIAVHREDRDLRWVVSRFAQPVGLWSGSVTVGGVTYQLRNVPGVSEDQFVRW